MFSTTPSFYWELLFLAGWLLEIGHFIDLPFVGLSLIFAIMHAWSRYEPDTVVDLFWGIQVKGFQLPLAFMVLNVIAGILDDWIGWGSC